MDVGFIGLGKMGGAIARRLAARRPLAVYDLKQEAMASLADVGAQPVASAAELARRSDVVMLCLPTSEDVRRALFDAGVAAALKPGGLVVDMTTGDPTATRDMAARLSETGRAMIDAPVSGGPMGAEAGTLAIMVGAADDLFAHIRPVLEEVSPNVMHAGGVGAGHTMKLVNNLVSAGNRLVVFEAVAMGVKNGLDPATCVAILQKSSGRSFTTEVIFPRFILTGTLDQNFTIGLMHKDVTLASRLAEASGTPLAMGRITRQVLDAAVAAGEADADLCTLIRRYEQAAGVKIAGEK